MNKKESEEVDDTHRVLMDDLNIKKNSVSGLCCFDNETIVCFYKIIGLFVVSGPLQFSWSPGMLFSSNIIKRKRHNHVIFLRRLKNYAFL